VSTGRRPPPAKGEVAAPGLRKREAAVLESEQVVSADKPIKEALELMLIIADSSVVQKHLQGRVVHLVLFLRGLDASQP
jgi:hypothetical protein